MVAQVIVGQKRRHEQPAEQEELVDPVITEHDVGGNIAEIGVHRSVVGPVDPDVGERVSLGLSGDDHFGRHGIEAEEAAAGLDVGMGGFDHRAQPHGRDPPPGCLRREEAPIVEHVAGHRIGHVVCGQRESLHGQPDLPRCEFGR